MSFNIEAIGFIQSPFKEKFGIPRQPGLTQSIRSTLRLQPPFSDPESVRGLETCSHIWIIFIFNATQDKGWHPTVRPPRLGGNQRLGVFATRSTFRPNPIGLSVVRLVSIEKQGKELCLEIADSDLLDGTPVLDIKPYLPYADCLPDAHFPLGKAPNPLPLNVIFSEQARSLCETIEQDQQLPLATQITEVLQCDPRPAYQTDLTRVYGIRLHQFNVRWQVLEDAIHVLEIDTLIDTA